jgi:ubiquinone/menaquinone biosynthesis C-methylase UbiE
MMIQTAVKNTFLTMLRCPVSGEALHQEDDWLVSQSGQHRYRLNAEGIPLFAEHFISEEGRAQQEHYDRIAAAYLENLAYPHTQEYMAYLDRVFLDQIGSAPIGSVAEICCGRGEAFLLIGDRTKAGVGVDVSVSMLSAARKTFGDDKFFFVQGDATMMPIEDNQFDTVVMLGGIHHVNDRQKLFDEIHRILKPGGNFYWREPVSDFFLWRGIRAIVYRLSSTLDHNTERPLVYEETVPPLEKAGFRVRVWQTYGFLGFCLFMNSDVLVFNRFFRFIPGIRAITRFFTRLDDFTTRLPGLRRAGLQVVGVAEKTQ